MAKARDFIECCNGSTVLSLCESGIGSNPISMTMTPAFAGSSPASPAKYGELVELADTLDLGSSAAKHKGSSPLLPTKGLLPLDGKLTLLSL